MNNSEKSIYNMVCFVIHFVLLVMNIFAFFLGCYLIRDIFNWFVIDYFSLEPINVWVVVGISLCCSLLKGIKLSDIQAGKERIEERKALLDKRDIGKAIYHNIEPGLVDVLSSLGKIIFIWIFASLCYNLFM